MTTMQIDRAVVEQALEALKSVKDHRPNDETNNAITALRAALAQQDEPVEPVATLTAQRDALLEALKAMLEQFNYHTISGIVHDESSAIDRARAAIRARTP